MSTFIDEINTGSRFEFGKNWQRFLSVLSDNRIEIAIQSLKDKLKVESLEGKSFLDVGSGSGLFSLAARKLGAKVYSFDYDPQSVACARELRKRYFSNDLEWTIEQGSVLDLDYLNPLGKFDIVHSWGVLHHTGKMYEALDNASELVAPGGKLFIAIYKADTTFEVASPEQVFDFYKQKGFMLEYLKTCKGELGCNEFIFVKG